MTGHRFRPRGAASGPAVVVGRRVRWCSAGALGVALVCPWWVGSPASAATGETCDASVVVYDPGTPPVLDRLAAERAWERSTGKGIIVGVVDSGVDRRNAHLREIVSDGRDLVGLDADPSGTFDVYGHGTAVAGVIAARPVEGSGVVGLAKDAMILPVRVYYAATDQANADGVGVEPGRIAAGILYAVENGAKIINVSLSSTEDTPEMRAAVEVAASRGALVVASAGNRNTTEATRDSPRYPAAYEGVLAVSTVDLLDQPTPDAIHGPHVDVAAPGMNVLTAYFAAGDCLLETRNASTSYATAYTSAAAALIAAEYPNETPAQWKYRLEVTAARAQPDQRDDFVGWGIIRPDVALDFIDDGTALGPPSPVHARESAAPAAVGTIRMGSTGDPLGETRETAAWWVIGGAAAVLLASLVTRLSTVSRVRSASEG